MLSFATVVRNQPNKYVNASKISPKPETKEESVDYGFFECNFETDCQDAEEGWGSKGNCDDQDKPYDCYVGTTPSPKTRAWSGLTSASKSDSLCLKEEEESFSASPETIVSPPVQPEVNIKPAQADEPQAGGQEVDKQTADEPTADAPEADELESDEAEADEVFETDCESNDSYLFADALHHKFKTCIDLLRNVSPKKDALVVVDGKTTPVSLMAAFLCLSGITAGTAGQSSVAVQVATNDDLKMVKRPVDVVINFNMAMSLKGLADRGAVLGKDGHIKTLLIDSYDKRNVQTFVAELFKCGLPIPHELESYVE